MAQSTEAQSGKQGTLLKSIAKRAHRFFFFAPIISRITWPLLGWGFRKRPCIATLDRALDVDGDIIECGVFWGRSLITMARKAKRHGKSSKQVFALDSFDGFQEDSIGECDLGKNRTMKKVQSRFKQEASIVPGLRRLASRMGLNVTVVPGYFEDTLPAIAKDRTFCYIHLDCDIYSSYKTCLPLLYPQLADGGVMIFDEYRTPVWPGATQAIDEFFADKPEKPQMAADPNRPNSPKWFVVKAQAHEQTDAQAA